jgi:ABC-type nitrate/sulfonate/bicarbonate transport system substrate-binding protein
MSDHIWYTHCPFPTAFGVALRKGWIHDEMGRAGIEVRALGASGDPDVQRFRREKTAPRSFRQGGNVAPLIARSRGNDIRLIGLSRTTGGYPLLTLPDSGIRTANDLIGRRIAIPRRPYSSVDIWRAAALRTAGNLLATSGLNTHDVELVDVVIKGEYFENQGQPGTPLIPAEGIADTVSSAQKAEVLALLRGEVDAIASEAATASLLATTLGLIEVQPGKTPVDAINNRSLLAVTVSGGLLDREPELVVSVLVQILAAAEWSIDEEAESKRLIALEAGIHEDLLERSFSPSVNRQLSVDLRPDKVGQLISQHDFLLEHGFLENEVDFDQFIEAGPLQTALARRGVLI